MASDEPEELVAMDVPRTAILHYSAPPVVGGVEAVILAHAQTFVDAGYPVTIIAGRGEPEALPEGVDLVVVPEIDSQHAEIVGMSEQLAEGQVPAGFEAMAGRLYGSLAPVLGSFDNLIVHNVFTKHFNLPLTVALDRLLNGDSAPHCIAWCHDLSWTSPSSSSKVHPGYPWDLLRTCRPDVTYVVVSERRQEELASLLACAQERIHVIYNGVDQESLLGLSAEGLGLIERLDLLDSDLVLLMPVRVTRAKNIEYALQLVAALKGPECSPKLIVTGPPDPHDADSMAYFESLQALRQELGVVEELRFVYESGLDAGVRLLIDTEVVGDLFRVSDVMFMPSHREGFAMPVLEAGLIGIPVITTEVPAAMEIGGPDVILFDKHDSPDELAARILAWAADSQVHRLRRRVSQNYTWEAIFERDIEPLLRRPGAG
jgi:glycosyltransferase involved in cell wall biosynthesis